jgi:catechol 2,3-dioxygenase-like lactoylglutathione lyase family enzyme
MMKTLYCVVMCCAMLVTVFGAPALAQTASQGVGVANLIDHVHLAAPDPPNAVEWYLKYFGGEKIAEGPDRIMYGQVRLIFLKSDKALPSSESSADQIGFSVKDVRAIVGTLQADGIKIVTPVRTLPGLYDEAVVEDPWGTRIDIVQDPQKLGLHHVHLRSGNAAGSLAWYVDKFGGKVAKMKGRIDGIDYGGFWLLIENGPAMPSQGHSIDHIGFRPINLDGVIAALKANNVKVLQEPRALKLGGGVSALIAFVEGPDGARIELVQRD